MDIEKNQEVAEIFGKTGDEKPKHLQFNKMLTFRVVPAYLKEIEKVAKTKGVSVSKLIRTYIKEGMKRDGELTDREDKEFSVGQ
jgi:predicted HicB family RNase H-like nuclease